jgi:hypothetical protein
MSLAVTGVGAARDFHVRPPTSPRTRQQGLSCQLYFSLNFRRDIEGKIRQADGPTAVGADFPSKQFQNQIGKAIDDAGLLLEAGSGIHHAENFNPGGDAVEIAESAVQAAED